MEGLALDLKRWESGLKDKQLVSIYFGGGTPALLGPKALKKILDDIQTYLPFDPASIEITLEANPETITEEKMRAFAEAGINRVSIGIQSLDNQLLKLLGRSHLSNVAIKAIEDTAHAGITNISIDLMYDIPGQSLASWQNTLNQVLTLPITHLSLYNLTIEPHTVFFKYRETLLKQLPDAECSTQMYKNAVETLATCGLQQYEISAFAKDNKISQHNVGYWTARPFLGFGPSAFSYWEGKRFRAIANLNRYVQLLRNNQSPIDFSEELPQPQKNNELLAIAIRLRAGVNLKTFEEINGKLAEATFIALKDLEKNGYINWKNESVALTDQGVLFYDTVAIELI